ncbi:MAG: energy transducer TonB [Saprospiraceae bacterium]|nr:energy transducer TonB [Saprospiraceae bacterium]
MIRFSISIFLVSLFNLQQSYCQNIADSKINSNNKEPEIFSIVEKNPSYIGGQTELVKYINHKMDELISPDEIEVEGKVILQFVVEKDGNLSDIKVVRGLTQKENETAILIVESMPKWEPGCQRGIPVNVRYTLPISFRKERVEYQDNINKIIRSQNVITYRPAEFNGGNSALNEYIKFTKNMNYITEKVYQSGSTPFVKIKFTVLTDGSIADIKSVYCTNADYKKEAIRIVNTMPKWIPATKNGVVVDDNVDLIIEFPND